MIKKLIFVNFDIKIQESDLAIEDSNEPEGSKIISYLEIRTRLPLKV